MQCSVQTELDGWVYARLENLHNSLLPVSAPTSPLWENMLIVEAPLYALVMVIMMLQLWRWSCLRVDPGWKSETWRAMHSLILLPSTFFPPCPSMNSIWSCTHCPPTGCNAERILRFWCSTAERDIFGRGRASAQFSQVSPHSWLFSTTLQHWWS